MGSLFLKVLAAGDIATVLARANAKIAAFAESISVPAFIFYVLGAVLAVGAGFLGYKLIKLLVSLSFTVVGYALGEELYLLVAGYFKLESFDWLAYVAGAVVAILFFFLAFKKFSYAFCAVMGVVGFMLGFFYVHDVSLALGCGIVLALVCMFMIRPAFILLTSGGGAFVAVSMVSALLPDVSYLKLNEGYIGLLVALGLTVLFVLVQVLTTHGDAKKENAKTAAAPAPKRRVKRRIIEA